MADCIYTIQFDGPLPDPLAVGDLVKVGFVATVKSLEADLLDVTMLGSARSEFVLGEVTVALVANDAAVVKAR